MATGSTQSNNSVTQAKQRLNSALDGLVAALAKKADAPAADDGLQAELDAARKEITDFKNKNQTVSNRLDTAIGNLKTILGDK
ncbi:MAG: hypothetical protein VW169_11215 [Rhodospirillaceae bacterium]